MTNDQDMNASDDDNEIDEMDRRAEFLARERGYYDRPSSELLQMAEELWDKHIVAVKAMVSAPPHPAQSPASPQSP